MHRHRLFTFSKNTINNYLEIIIALKVWTMFHMAGIELNRLLARISGLPFENVVLDVIIGDRSHLFDYIRQLQGLEFGHLLFGQ
jgi:hypothetical protein